MIEHTVEQAVILACTYLRRRALNPAHVWADENREALLILLDFVEDSALLGFTVEGEQPIV